ncbi:MAG: hypothetical protein KDC98_24680, partial [Planctomycetes bacterium]|nr:hypothetical protein [Planctomycetota bacterium]
MHYLLCLLAALVTATGAVTPHDPERHLEILTRQLAAAPHDNVLRLQRGRLYAALGELTLALEDHLLVMRRAPDWGAARASAAAIYWQLDEPSAALAQLDAAILLGCDDAEVHRLRGRVLAELDRHGEAAQAFATALLATA